MNRAQRRKAEKNTPKYLQGKNIQDLEKALYKNGITEKDLEKEFKEGFSKGRGTGIEATIKTIYAAVMLAANKEFGFGKERALRLLCEVDNILIASIGSDEDINAVWEKFGVKIDFAAGVDRVEQKKVGG